MKIKHPKVVIYSLMGLICLILAFTINGYFIIGAAIFSGLGWKELYKK